MNIIINGTSRPLDPAKNLFDLVGSFNQQPKHVIAELNGSIIPSDQWVNTKLQNGDTLELVTFVGGG